MPWTGPYIDKVRARTWPCAKRTHPCHGVMEALDHPSQDISGSASVCFLTEISLTVYPSMAAISNP